MKNFFWKKKEKMIAEKLFWKKTGERWKTFLEKKMKDEKLFSKTHDRWKSKNKKMSDVEKKKKKKLSERKMKEILPRSVKLWLKSPFLRFSVWKQHMDRLEKMPSLLTLIWRKLFFGRGELIEEKNRAMRHILLRTNI